jgi:hypothetical protein
LIFWWVSGMSSGTILIVLFGRVRILYKILGGNVLQENLLVEDNSNLAGYEGKSWSVFNTRDDTWRQTWVDNQSGYIEFKGVLEDNRKIFRTKIKVQGEKDFVSQKVFYNISPNSFTWDWMRSENGGEDWVLLWRIYYKRQE